MKRKIPKKWSFEEGILTVWHGSKPIVLGYFETHREAMMAAAAYFAVLARLARDGQLF